MNYKNISGFTLMEVLIYLALFAVILGGAFGAAGVIIQSSGRSQSQSFLQEEGDFILAKFNWAMSGAFSVTATSSRLSIGKYDSASNPLVFDLTGASLSLAEGAAPPEVLNSSSVIVSSLYFLDIPASAGRPGGVDFGFTLKSAAAGGLTLSRDFTATDYLWK